MDLIAIAEAGAFGRSEFWDARKANAIVGRSVIRPDLGDRFVAFAIVRRTRASE
jgi:hypothetical protein